MPFVWDRLPALCPHNTWSIPRGCAAPEQFWSCLKHRSHLYFTLNKLLVRNEEYTPVRLCREHFAEVCAWSGEGCSLEVHCERSIWSSVTPKPALVFKQSKSIYTSCPQSRISNVPLYHLIFTYVLLILITASSKYRHTFWKKIRRGN